MQKLLVYKNCSMMSVMKLSCKFVYKTAQCVSTYQKDLIPFMSKASNFRVCPTILQRLCSNLLSSHGQNFTRHQHFRCLTLTPLTFFFLPQLCSTSFHQRSFPSSFRTPVYTVRSLAALQVSIHEF